MCHTNFYNNALSIRNIRLQNMLWICRVCVSDIEPIDRPDDDDDDDDEMFVWHLTVLINYMIFDSE